MDTGQRLIAWLCDRYADYRAGLPVSLNQRMARGVEYDETGIPPHTCPKCSLRILDGFYDCPLCQTHLNVPKPPVSGGKLLLKAIANGAFR